MVPRRGRKHARNHGERAQKGFEINPFTKIQLAKEGRLYTTVHKNE